MRRSSLIGLAAAIAMVWAGGANAAFVLVNENFDSIGPNGTAPPSGWTIGHLSPVTNRDPTNGNTRPIVSETMLVDDGSNNGDPSGFSFNYGSTGASDRALGNVPKTTNGDHVVQVAVTNSTGYTLDSLTISYWGEQWRQGQCTPTAANGPEKLRVYYSTSATAGYIRVNPLDFFAPQTSTASPDRALDGNAAANRISLSSGVLTTSIAPGATLYIRWYDYNDDGTRDHGLAIDDVLVTATPEPATMLLLVLGGLAMLRRR